MVKDNKQRQAEFKERMRSGGFVQITAWVHADDKARAIKYLKSLTDKRR